MKKSSSAPCYMGTVGAHLPPAFAASRRSRQESGHAKVAGEISKDLPSFGRHDILLVNLLSAAQLAAIYLSLEQKPSCEQMKQYYGVAMDNSRVIQTFLISNDYYSLCR